MENSSRPSPNRRQVLKGLGVVAGITVAGGGGAAWLSLSGPSSSSAGDTQRSAPDALADAVTSGGPGKDGIPAIDQPRFASATQADFLSDDEPVFGLDYRGEVRAYPQQVLVWHEIVNDTVGGEGLSVTYCPLTGTVIGFRSPPGQVWTFGTTGNLVNSNLLMYDRQTESEWPQILGTAISGERRGQRLDTVALVWTTWKAWRTLHPDTIVLSTDTGALRDYGSDPYGSYTPPSGYYTDDGLYFPVQHSDDRLPNKEVVIGVRVADSQVAIRKELVRRDETVELEIAGTPLVARWDHALKTARVVHRDSQQSADFLDAMWFAWHAFYPSTRVLA